jgi:outer membrane protein, heavy metal efflux system
LVAQPPAASEPDRLSLRLFAPPGTNGGPAFERLPVPADSSHLGNETARFRDCELSVDELVADVLDRHPSIEAAAAAWQAAAARYPQVVSLDDPMFDFMTAPGSIGSRDVDFAYVLQGRQKIPWPGKRPLRGAVAAHESRAMYQDVAEARLRLELTARQAYFAYFSARQLLALNATNRQAVDEFRGDALARYEANLVSRQDVLLADVERADLERRQIELRRAERVAIARINTLLLRPPYAPLPSPPARLPDVAPPPESELLIHVALEQRPDVAAAASRWHAEQAGVSLAQREFKPDLELVGRYDSFWLPQQALTGQLGVTVNVPLARERRRAAVREASAKTTQRRAELDGLVAQTQFEVQEAYEQLEESRQVVLLYAERIIPAAEDSVQSAAAEYQTGKLDFLRLIQAQRDLIGRRELQVEAVAEYHIRRAELERAIGGPLPLMIAPPDTR